MNKKSSEKDKGQENNQQYPKKKKYFYFRQKSVLLTYARTDKSGLNKTELGDFLKNTFHPDVVVVCLETHADGNPHLHAWVEWTEEFYSSNPRIFDCKGHHPHIGVMLKRQRNTRENALNYMCKEDEELYAFGINIQDWKYNTHNKKYYIAMDLLNKKVSLPELIQKKPELLFEYQKIKNNITTYNIDSKPLKNIYKTKENLWIFGASGTGKTYYVQHNHPTLFNKPLNKWWDGYVGQDIVLLDDFDSKSYELGHYIKIWADNYGSYGEYKNGTIALTYTKFIITSQYLPGDLWKDIEMVKAISRRFTFVTVTGSFPDFKLSKFDYKP